MAGKPEQYRIIPVGTSSKPLYKVQVTWGLLDVQTFEEFYNTFNAARAAAKHHALRYNISSPIILR